MIKTGKCLNFAFAVILLSRAVIAHEGHGVPGSTPPAPHGGVVKEAKGEGKELFFEVVHSGKKLEIYPLQVNEQNAFVPVPSAELSGTQVKVEIPRTKSLSTVTMTGKGEVLSGNFDAGSVNRFLVHILTKYSGQRKQAKIQIEK